MAWDEGKWLVICQRCGKRYKNDEVTKEWTGLIVCKVRCYETRHPQDFVKGRPDDMSVPLPAPRPPDQFVTPTYIATTIGNQEPNIPVGTFTTNNKTL